MLFTIFPKPVKHMPYQRHDENGNPVTPKPYQRHDENNSPVPASVSTSAPVVAEEPVAEVDTSFLDAMTKKELLAWSEAQGWDLVNGKLKSEILAECREIALGTFDGTPLA